MMQALNPNSDFVQELETQWPMIAALIVSKFGGEIILTDDDIRELDTSKCLSIEETDEGLRLALVPEEDGIAAAREAGGLPV